MDLYGKEFMAKRLSGVGNTKHHRKPESLGGRNNKGNLSFVPHFRHKAWHTLFYNYSVTKILALFQDYYGVFNNNKKTVSQILRDREWTRAKDSRLRKRQAWDTLFRGLTIGEIVNKINK